MAKCGALAVTLLCLAVVLTPARTETKPWMEKMRTVENQNRAKHSSPALQFDEGLTTMAQQWADKLVTACGKLTHDSHSPDGIRKYKGGTSGENLGTTQLFKNPENRMKQLDTYPSEAAQGWYTEVKNYPWPVYTGQALNGVIDHFTQQVWMNTTLVGYGLGVNPTCQKAFVVARYWPMGNIDGGYASNVIKDK